MNCDDIGDLIGPYLDDDLPERTRERVEKHLLQCRECAWDAMTLQITRNRLRGEAPETVASDAFRARALARLMNDNPHLAESGTPAADPEQFRLPIRL